jgi:hypothetical protein
VTANHVDTSQGPAVQIFADQAVILASALGRALELMPGLRATEIGRELQVLRRDLIEVADRRQRGDGFRSESGREGFLWNWVTAAQAASRTGVSPQTITAWCRSGSVPGAHHEQGHGWFIPPEVLPDLEDADDDHAAA